VGVRQHHRLNVGIRSGVKSPATVITAVAALSAVLAVVLSVIAGWGSPAWWALPVMALAIGVAEKAAVRLVVGRQAFVFALHEAFVAVGLMLAPGAWIAVAYVLGVAVVEARMGWVKLRFNLAMMALSAAASVLVTQELGGGVVAASAGLLTFYVINQLLVSVPVALTTHEPYRRVLVLSMLSFIHYAGTASLGLLAAWLAVYAPAGLLGLVVPLGLLWWSHQQQTRRTSEATLFAELARGQEKVGGSADASAEVVVTAAARLFGAAEVEMLVHHPDGMLRYAGDETGVISRVRGDAEALDAPWVLRALAARGVFVGQDGARPFCSAVLGDPERPQAVLVAHRPERAAPFTRADVQLAEVLVRQAESWLSVAELSARRDEALGRAEAYGAANRVLGEVSQETVPALAVLRESAHRLSRLATRFDGPDAVDEIVAELYSVERAVASLLGAIALASDAAAVAPALTSTGSAPARTDAEWTTTGRLEDAVGP
jgi:hypothetical protein